MPDADPLLATVTDLGALVGETIADDDAKALLLLRVASGIVREKTHQHLSPVADDVVKLPVHTSPRGVVVFLPQLPVKQVTLIEALRIDGTFTALAAADWHVDEDTGEIRLWRWPLSYAERWRVTYDHGYDVIPEPISDAVLGLAARAWETPIGVENERIGQRSIKYLMLATGFDPLEETALADYTIARGTA